MRQESTRDPEGIGKIWWRCWAENKVTIEHFLRSPWALNTVLSKIYTSLDPVSPACRQECCPSNEQIFHEKVSTCHSLMKSPGTGDILPALTSDFRGRNKKGKTFPFQKLIQLVNLGNYHNACISLKVYLEG